MDFIESSVDFLKNEEKSFIIHPAWRGVDFFESSVDFLKNKDKSFIIHLARGGVDFFDIFDIEYSTFGFNPNPTNSNPNY